MTYKIEVRSKKHAIKPNKVVNVIASTASEARNIVAHFYKNTWCKLATLLIFLSSCSSSVKVCPTYGYKKVYVNGRSTYFIPGYRKVPKGMHIVKNF